MTRGYRLPRPDPTAADPWAGFEWTLGEEYNVAAAALETAQRDPERPALRHTPLDGGPTTVTYDELDRATEAFGARLADRGVKPGDRVGVCLPQCPELIVAHLATFAVGAVVVPLSMLLGADSFAYSLDHGGVSLLVADVTRAAELGDVTESVLTLRVDPGGYDESPLGGLRAHGGDGAASFDRARTAPDDPALILYTSGTTGKPKGVVGGHRYLAGSLPGYQAWFELFDESEAAAARVWTPAEWAWAGALFDVVFPTLALGGTVVSNERRSGFDPEAALELVVREGVTHAFMPATALGRIRNEATPPGADESPLEVVMSGGERLPTSLRVWTEDELAPTVNEAYGQTEANALVGNCTAAYPARAGSMGRAYPGHDVRIVDGDGETVPPGEVGEIALVLPDPAVFLGYWDDERATDEKFRGDLFLTGDVGVCDADGYLRHRGRADDLILTAGYRVSPLEVEASLEDRPDVAEAVVGGVPDDRRGSRVKAFVVPAEGVDPGDELADRLREAVRADLGAHKVPREFTFLDAMPETRSGKADRSALFD